MCMKLQLLCIQLYVGRQIAVACYKTLVAHVYSFSQWRQEPSVLILMVYFKLFSTQATHQWWYYFRPLFSADVTIQIEMLVCFFADSFRVRFSNFVSLWCFSQRFRGGRSATTGLTFIPCPHWVLRPHLNCLTLWGRLSETFSAQKPQMATFTTCWLVPIFVKSRSPVESVLMYSAERGANCSSAICTEILIDAE